MSRFTITTHAVNWTSIALLAAYIHWPLNPGPVYASVIQTPLGAVAAAIDMSKLEPIVTAKPSHKPVPPPAARHPLLRASL